MLPNRNRSQRKLIYIYNINTLVSCSCTHVYFFNAVLHCVDDDDAYACAFEF